MTELHYDYVKRPGQPTELKLTVDGSHIDTICAIGRLIQKVHDETPAKDRRTFRMAIQALVRDESPIWEPMKGICIDLKALEKQAAEGKPGE